MNRYFNGRGSTTIPWLLQRLSAAILVVLLIIHFWIGHYAEWGAPVTFAGVSLRLQTATFVGIDALLLVLVVFHGFNGMRNIILDYPAGLQHKKSISLFLLILGIATVMFGMYSLYPFITGGR